MMVRPIDDGWQNGATVLDTIVVRDVARDVRDFQALRASVCANGDVVYEAMMRNGVWIVVQRSTTHDPTQPAGPTNPRFTQTFLHTR